jgi:hypothetical protein
MPFTIRSLFQQSPTEGQPAGATALLEPGPPTIQARPNAGMPIPTAGSFGMEVPPPSPFGGSLFTAREGDGASALPVQARQTGSSPFSPMEAAQTASLTVGDVLPLLPTELARANSLPPEQPIAIAPQLIEAALNSGHAAIPIFEIYRVCPAIFMMPVSPQDSRQVPLPPAKLPALVAASRNNAHAPAPATQAMPPALPAAPSPFAAAAAPAPFADFAASARSQSAAPAPQETAVPHPGPATPSPFGAPAAAQPPANMFASAASPFAATPAAAAQPSPFSFQAAQPQVAAQAPAAAFASPAQPAAFGEAAKPAPEAGASGSTLNSVFGQTPPAVPSPFAMPSAPAQHAEPAAQAPSPSPFAATQIAQPAPPPFALTEPDPAPQPQAPASSPFLQAQAAAPAPAPAPAAQPASSSPAASNGALKLSLATLVKAYPASELGFDPGMVPSWIMTSVPAASIQGQTAAGSGHVELGQLIDATTDVGFRSVLSSARRNLMIQLPASDPGQYAPQAAQPASAPAFTTQPAPVQAPEPAAAAQPMNPFAAAKAAQAAQADAPAGPIQPKPNAVFDFSLLAATPAPAPAPAQEVASPSPVQPKPMTSFDPFAAATGPAASPQAGGPEGFSSEQLFGEPASPRVATPPPMPAMPESQMKVPVEPSAPVFTALPGIPPPPAAAAASPFQAVAPQAAFSPVPASMPSPFGMPPAASAPPAQPFAFSPPAPLPEATPAFVAPSLPPAPPAPVAAAAAPPISGSILGITPVAVGDPEQVMLRALLGVNEDLTVGRVVDLISRIPGVAACSCVNGSSAVSHGGSSQTAQDFQRQAGDLARNIQALAPLIGITGAETFSINTSDRLMTFSFHPPIALGVLHQDDDLASGLRDKITLVGRELARMVSKTGGHIA